MKKVVLAILDGVGYSRKKNGNALYLAKTPNLDKMIETYPHSLLHASGKYVGLPKGQMGNSEVGHLTIGAGRIKKQSLEVVNDAIKDKSFDKDEDLIRLFNFVKKNNSKLHICGLLSDGGVHSHIDHIIKTIELAHENGIKNIYVHAFLDGRDTYAQSTGKYLKRLEATLKKTNAHLATMSGRYYSMDRENMWDKTKMCYDAMVYGKGKEETNYKKVLQESYKNKIDDEFIIPTILDKKGIICDGDGIFVANIRADRITQLFSAISNKDFSYFETKKFKNIKMLTMFPVTDSVICENLFEYEDVNDTLGEVLSKNGLRVLRISEVSKYAHITHFIDGNKDVDYPNTDKVKIPRKDVSTYDLYPAMSSYEITDYITKNMKKYDFVIVNYPNGDMVGHTGNLEASTKAMEAIDENIGKLKNACDENNFTLIITADHGNCEEMIDELGNPSKIHSTNKVLFIIGDKNVVLKNGGLANIAPSVLSYLGITIPNTMVLKTIVKNKKKV